VRRICNTFQLSEDDNPKFAGRSALTFKPPQMLSEHGRWPESPDPFVILPGPHGYFVQFVGVTERAAINKEYEEMLARLCKTKEAWCLPQ